MSADHYAINTRILDGSAFQAKSGPSAPRFRPGLRLVIFERLNTEVLFVAVAAVTEVERIQDEIPLEQVTLAKADVFKKARELRVLAGSLEKVYRFLTPERHFRRNVVALSSRDFSTIVQGRIDVARSIFKYVFAAIPFRMQAEFASIYSKLAPDGRARTYTSLAPLLMTYVVHHLSTPLQQLERIRELYGGIDLLEKPALESLVVGEEDDGRSDIPLGRAIEESTRFLNQTQLLRPRGDRPPLLDDCRRELLLAHKEDEDCRWNEKIF